MNEFLERYTTLVILKRQYAVEKTDSLKRQVRIAQIKLGETSNVLRILRLVYKGYNIPTIANSLGYPEDTVRLIIKRWSF